MKTKLILEIEQKSINCFSFRNFEEALTTGLYVATSATGD